MYKNSVTVNWKKITQAISDKGFSKKYVSTKIGKCTSFISMYESKDLSLNASDLFGISTLLRIKPKCFLKKNVPVPFDTNFLESLLKKRGIPRREIETKCGFHHGYISECIKKGMIDKNRLSLISEMLGVLNIDFGIDELLESDIETDEKDEIMEKKGEDMTNKEFKDFCRKALPLVREMIDILKEMDVDDLMSVAFSADGYIRLNSCEDGSHATLTNASESDHPILEYEEELFDDDI